MNEMELKKLWQSANGTYEEHAGPGPKHTDTLTRVKVHTLLRSMQPVKLFALLIGLLWVGVGTRILLPLYAHPFSEANKFFLYSATFQVLITAIALFLYIYQLIKIHQVDISDSIVQTQEKLAQLNISTLWSARILFLQLPCWTTFWWNASMIAHWRMWQWGLTVFVTASFTFLAIWLFVNLKFENRNKKWFMLLLHGKEWTPLLQSMDLLEQLEAYKTDADS